MKDTISLKNHERRHFSKACDSRHESQILVETDGV